MKGLNRGVFRSFIFLFLILSMFITSCNFYDFLHKDGEDSDINVTLANADKAMNDNDYSKAADLYMSVITKDSDNSKARIGYASAIILRDITIADIPELMNSIYGIGTNTNTTNSYLNDLAGKSGLTIDQYKNLIIDTTSNASYYRSPVIGIDPVTGMIATNAFGLPVATLSDGVIPVDDRTTMLNYIIIKAVHVVLLVQEEFYVNANLVTGIDVGTYTNGNWTTEQGFTNLHVSLTNGMRNLSNVYINMTNMLLTTNNNISPMNLIDVSTVMLNVITNSGFSAGTLTEASNAIGNMKSSLSDFIVSITNDSLGIQAGFQDLVDFRTAVETAGAAWLGY